MKRRIALSIALGLGVLALALVSSDSTVKAQPKRVFVADTGMITLGPDQTLRITVANGPNTATVRFRRLEYLPGICDSGVCKHSLSSQTVSDPITLAPGEAASFDLGDPGTHGVRGVVTSDLKNVQVTSYIMKTSTGEVISVRGRVEFEDVHVD